MRTTRRPGAATIWALVVLAVVAAATAAATARFVAARRAVAAREHAAQAEWLARGGCELAVARLLADPAGYAGETARPRPDAAVTVTVRRDGDTFFVTSEARFPTDSPRPAVRTVRRTVSRTAGPAGVRAVVTPADP